MAGGQMKSFTYTAKDVNGNVKKGTIVAESEREFNEKLHDKGLYVTSYKESDNSQANKVHKFNTKELAFNCRQLAAMMSSGLTLVKSLDILCREQETEAAKNIWRDIYENVQKGESFSSSLEMYNGCFPPFLISMVGAGESSGSLDVIMTRMSDHYAKENKMNNTIKGAMTYPIVLAVLAIAIVIIMFTFVMPTFADLFSSPEDMPAMTRVMMNFSDFLIDYWWLCILIVVGLVFGISYALKVPSMRYKFDRFKIKGPGFGPLIVKVYTGRFARTMSSLYSSGIPMVECLQRASDVLGNSYISDKFNNVIDEVKQGEPLSAAIQRTEIFDSMFCSIIYVGEEAGALDEILTKTSDYYEEESDSAIQRLVSMLEPVMIIIMGIGVGCIVAAVLPALYASFDSVAG